MLDKCAMMLKHTKRWKNSLKYAKSGEDAELYELMLKYMNYVDIHQMIVKMHEVVKIHEMMVKRLKMIVKYTEWDSEEVRC